MDKTSIDKTSLSTMIKKFDTYWDNIEQKRFQHIQEIIKKYSQYKKRKTWKIWKDQEIKVLHWTNTFKITQCTYQYDETTHMAESMSRISYTIQLPLENLDITKNKGRQSYNKGVKIQDPQKLISIDEINKALYMITDFDLLIEQEKWYTWTQEMKHIPLSEINKIQTVASVSSTLNQTSEEVS